VNSGKIDYREDQVRLATEGSRRVFASPFRKPRSDIWYSANKVYKERLSLKKDK